MQILISIIAATGVIVTEAMFWIRALMLAGIGRARIAVIYAAWIATSARAIQLASAAYIRSITQVVVSQQTTLYDNVIEAAVFIQLRTGGAALAFGVGKAATHEAAIAKGYTCAISNYLNTPAGRDVARSIAQQAQQRLNNTLAGLPALLAGAVAFFSTPPSAQSAEEECSERSSQGNFVVRVYTDAQCSAKAILKNGTWQLQSSNITYKLRIDSQSGMDAGIYNEVKSWLSTLNPDSVASQLNPSPNPNFQQQINQWIQQLNLSGPPPGGSITTAPGAAINLNNIYIRGSQNTNTTFTQYVGSIDINSNISVKPSLPCLPQDEECDLECPPVDSEYIVISKDIYEALLAGGTFSGNAWLNEPGWGGVTCNWTSSTSGTLGSGNCSGGFGFYDPEHCSSDYSWGHEAHVELSYSLGRFGTEYRMFYQGNGACPEAYDMSGNGQTFCYSVGYFINSNCDAGNCSDAESNGSPFAPVGDFNIVTSAGTITAKIRTFPNFGTGGATVTLIPFNT